MIFAFRTMSLFSAEAMGIVTYITLLHEHKMFGQSIIHFTEQRIEYNSGNSRFFHS